MNDSRPFVHGEEGTHYACEKCRALECCVCSDHLCKEEGKTPRALKNKKDKESRIRNMGGRSAYTKYMNTLARARRRILGSRTHGFCKICRGRFVVAQLTIDHIVPVADGGQNVKENLQVICRECHLTKTQEEVRRRLADRKPKASDLFY